MGDLVLNLGRMLGGRDDMHPVLQRNGGGDLAFQIEMLLPADLDFAFDHGGGLREALRKIAPVPQDRALFKAGIGGERVFHCQKRGEFGVGDLAQPRRLAGREVGLGDDKEDRLAMVQDLASGQQGFVLCAM